jgi:hypothetical protein
MPRVKKYHEGGKGPGHPHYTIDNKAERQAADAADYYDRYPERRPEAIAKKKEEKGTLFDSAADFFQYSPIIGEIVDLINIPYVAATGKDVYKGEPQSVQSAAAWGVGGLLLPNLIEKPAKWLIKQGAKNADDVASILRYHLNKNPADIPADLKPLLAFSKKNNEMRAFLSDKSPGFPFAGMDNVGSNKLKNVGGDLHDYIAKNRPDLINKFSVKNFESGMFDEVTRAWGDEYLVSLRGVRGENVDEAAEFLTSAKGGGERIQGPGINTSGSLNQVEPFGSGSKGYIGRLKVNEPYSSSANASTILDNIYNLEKEGGKLIPRSDDSRFLSKRGVTEGINTIDGTRLRVIKENTPVTVEDIIKTEGNDLSKIFRNPSEVTTLGYSGTPYADYDKVLDWTQSSGGNLNELYDAILKEGKQRLPLRAAKLPLLNPQTNKPIVFYHGTNKSAGDKILAEGFTGQTSLMNRQDYAQNYATSGPRTSGDKTGTIIESHVTLNNPMNSQQNIALREQIIGDITGKSPEQLASPGYGMTTAEWREYRWVDGKLMTTEGAIQEEFTKRAKKLGHDGIYDVNQPEITVFDPSSIKVVGSTSVGKKYDKGGALKGLMKKYGAGGSVGGWGAQGNFSTEYNSKQPSVAELPDPSSIPEQNALDALVESGEEPLTEEEKKKQKNQKALQGAMRGASMGMRFGPWGAVIGAVAGGALTYFAKQGAKIKKLYKGGGEVSEGKPDVKDLLHMLKGFGKEPRQPQGSWNMPSDKEGWVPRHDDIFKYLDSRGIDTKDDEIAKAYIMPGSVAGAGFVDGYDASAYSEKRRYVDPTKPSKPDLMNAGEFGAPPFPNAKGQRIMLASTQLKNPTTRIEEAVHSLQQQRFLDPSVSDSKIGGNKRRLYQMLKKQPWLKELSPDMRKTLTKGNYALRGSGSTSEFEAKLIASKMTMIQDGVLPEDGKVSDKDLEAIKQWYENYQNKTGEPLWESVLFQDFSDKKYRDEMLSTLNKI